MDSVEYTREVLDTVGQALRTPFPPGESSPASVHVFPTATAADYASQHGLVPPGSVIYHPGAGMAWVQLPIRARLREYIPSSAELEPYAGAVRVAEALKAYGPVRNAVVRGPGPMSTAELAAIEFPAPVSPVAVRPAGRGVGERSGARQWLARISGGARARHALKRRRNLGGPSTAPEPSPMPTVSGSRTLQSGPGRGP